MGTLFYGAARTPVLMDDHRLAHVQMVVATKLRRGESFMLSWDDAPSIGDGRSTVWIHDRADLHFKFDGSRPPALDRDLLDDMVIQSSSSRGLMLQDATLPAAVTPARPSRTQG